ncbi:hypothetical protein ACIPIN_06855 [Pseudomonas sp. NPDC087697]|uniref:hypothetical protein n=1 Tax=Pseudomonas sp. NPDC087697 TaxID=3364447 RepID=UPI0038008FB4
MAYIQGESRNQTSLFPVSLEELIPEDHLVRVIDLYVAKLDKRIAQYLAAKALDYRLKRRMALSRYLDDGALFIWLSLRTMK